MTDAADRNDMPDRLRLRTGLGPTLDAAVEPRRRRAAALQRPDGHWVFELEADATIPAEYVLLVHYLGEPADLELERKIGVYLRRIQGEHGGWPLFHDGAFDISATVKAYFALKMIGDDPDAPHMARAREAMLAHGGAARVQRLHPHPAGALRRHLLARGAGRCRSEIMLLPQVVSDPPVARSPTGRAR